MKQLSLIFFTAFISIGLSSCFKNPVTGRNSLNVVPESEMRTMANQQYATFLSSNTPMQGTKDAEMIQRVGKRMQAAVAQYLQSIGKQELISGYQWEFNLVDENTANAWCMPGGKVVFYTGIMPLCANEAGVAVVMGHEIAHAIARHGNERMSQGLITEFGGVALSVAFSEKPEQTQALFNTVYGVGTQLGQLAYSRSHESEADHMGLIFMAIAGYNPNEAVSFWQRMAAAGGAKPPVLLSTHPADQKRISDIRSQIPEAMKYYKPN